MRDQRDPQAVGKAILAMRRKRKSLSAAECADLVLARGGIPKYDAEHLGPIEKYGDPRKLPEG